MQIHSLTKITAGAAREICALAAAGGFKLPLDQAAPPAQYLQSLIALRHLTEAVQFLAFALPPREAVWWACICARGTLNGTSPAAPLVGALEAAEAWVRKPTEANRRAAMACAHATNFQSPAAWAAVAAFWSGGSMAPENLPEVPAPPHLLGSAVAGAVTLAAVQSDPARAEQKRERYLAAAIDIANGGNGRVAGMDGA